MPDDTTRFFPAPNAPSQAEVKPRILVLDDSRAQRVLLGRMLRRWGHEVTETGDPHEALRLVQDPQFSIILTDWMMDDMDGPEFCRRFRAMNRGAYGYVILLTSKSAKSDIAEGLDAGADDFLTKPVDGNELRARIRAGARIVAMQQELVQKNDRIGRALTEISGLYEAIDRDLTEAKALQESLVRETFRQFAGASVALNLRSSGHVGGDLVGFFPISKTRVGVFSLDVSGHGVSSGLLAARMAGLLSTAAPEQNIAMRQDRAGRWRALPPHLVAEKLNQMMFEAMETDLYLTLCLADLNLKTGKVRLVQAGHPHPVLLRADDTVEWIGRGGMPIGLVPDAEFESFEVRLGPGDRLLLHSDGFSEAADPSGAFLGEEGLERLFRKTAKLPCEEVLPNMVSALETFAERDEFDDDVSAALIAFRPEASAVQGAGNAGRPQRQAVPPPLAS